MNLDFIVKYILGTVEMRIIKEKLERLEELHKEEIEEYKKKKV